MEDFSQLTEQLEQLQKTIDEQNQFIRDCFDKLLSGKKKDSPKKEVAVKKNFDAF